MRDVIMLELIGFRAKLLVFLNRACTRFSAFCGINFFPPSKN